MERRSRMPAALAQRAREALERLYRDKFDQNASSLAKALGVSPAAISNIFAGKNSPGLELTERIAKLRGVDVDVLLGLKPGAGTALMSVAFAGGQRSTAAWFAEVLRLHPHLIAALAQLRKLGMASLHAQQAAAYAAAHLPDISKDAWISLMLAIVAASGAEEPDENRDLFEAAISEVLADPGVSS